MRYLIHACEERLWYVNEFLIPSLQAQGIPETYIFTWVDAEHKGNLFSCMDSFADCRKFDGGTWHLQDDVIISRRFKQETFKDFDEIRCGYCGKEIGPDITKIGYVSPIRMWFSFQCIYIPNYLACECANWFYNEAIYEERFKERIDRKKSDDYIWQRFVAEHHRDDVDIINLKLNLVDHIDYILGGSVINKNRTRNNTAMYFEDVDLIDDLKRRLDERCLQRITQN